MPNREQLESMLAQAHADKDLSRPGMSPGVCGQNRGAIVDARESEGKQRNKGRRRGKGICGEVLQKDVKWAQAI